MPVRQAILQKLVDSRNTGVERAIEVALRDALPEEQAGLADVLLQRNRRPGWVALIRAFHRLDASIQEKLLQRPRDLFGPLSETMHETDGSARENVIAIIQKCTDVRLVYLLAEALMDGRPDVRALAGNSLLEAVRRYWMKVHVPLVEQELSEHLEDPSDATPVTRNETDDYTELKRAVDSALRHFKTHRQTPALQAALICERQQDGSLWLLFQDPYDDRTRAATILLRAPNEPALAGAVLLALGSPLKPAAMAGLAAIEAPTTAAALADESYRLLDPVLREGSMAVNHLKLLPAMRKEPPWNLANWDGWLRLIELTGLHPTERLTWLTRMLEAAPAKPDAVAWKTTLARAIAQTQLPDACIPLSTLIGSEDERVARVAARYVGTRADWRERAGPALAASPYASVRRVATQVMRAKPVEGAPAAAAKTPAARGFEKAWNDFQRMPPAVQHSTARTLAADPALAEQLRVKFQGTPVEVAQALRMVAAMPNLIPYRHQIIALCGHSDPRIAASAVRLVGRLEDARLKELLEAAANHPDGRVRANAVQAMEELHIVDRSQQVLQLLNSRHSRERANAIKALGQFNFATARDCLTRMLTDSNPTHRISALWVVSQLNLLEVMRQVANIARRDPNLRVRKKAQEMIDTLSGTLAAQS